MFGIKRKTEGINGYKAILLWEKYLKRGQKGALELLLEYNKEDVLNLIPLEEIFASSSKSWTMVGQFEIGPSGRKVRGVLSVPGGNGKRPCVILSHGLISSKESAKYLALSDALGAIGMGSCRFDYHGCGQSDGNIEETTLTERLANLEAVTALVLDTRRSTEAGWASWGAASAGARPSSGRPGTGASGASASGRLPTEWETRKSPRRKGSTSGRT